MSSDRRPRTSPPQRLLPSASPSGLRPPGPGSGGCLFIHWIEQVFGKCRNGCLAFRVWVIVRGGWWTRCAPLVTPRHAAQVQQCGPSRRSLALASGTVDRRVVQRTSERFKGVVETSLVPRSSSATDAWVRASRRAVPDDRNRPAGRPDGEPARCPNDPDLEMSTNNGLRPHTREAEFPRSPPHQRMAEPAATGWPSRLADSTLPSPRPRRPDDVSKTGPRSNSSIPDQQQVCLWCRHHPG